MKYYYDIYSVYSQSNLKISHAVDDACHLYLEQLDLNLRTPVDPYPTANKMYWDFLQLAKTISL